MSLYVASFGLQQQPFRPTPDPGFLYLSPGHREALAQVLQGVQERKGFILLTGGIGTGKTTLLRTLLGRLDGDTVSSFIFETTLPFEGLLEYMLEDFGLAESGESQVQPLIALNQFLSSAGAPARAPCWSSTRRRIWTCTPSSRSGSFRTVRPGRRSFCRSCWPASRSSWTS